MKATGIVRRMDDLGRLAIPKEIRHSMKLEDNAPLEIWTAREDGRDIICLTKYVPIDEEETPSKVETKREEPKQEGTTLVEFYYQGQAHYLRLSASAYHLFQYLDDEGLLRGDEWSEVDDIKIEHFI